MILYIDSTQREELIVQLRNRDGSVQAQSRQTQGFNHAQNLLPMIEQVLAGEDLTLQNIEEIAVNVGPGSFTGTRVGVAVANALAFALQIPVNGQPAGKVMPVYDRAPNISQPKAGK